MEEITRKKMNLYAYRMVGVGVRGRRGISLGMPVGDKLQWPAVHMIFEE